MSVDAGVSPGAIPVFPVILADGWVVINSGHIFIVVFPDRSVESLFQSSLFLEEISDLLLQLGLFLLLSVLDRRRVCDPGREDLCRGLFIFFDNQ